MNLHTHTLNTLSVDKQVIGKDLARGLVAQMKHEPRANGAQST